MCDRLFHDSRWKKYLFTTAIMLAYFTAYFDWLQPGYLKFGFPAAWNQPLTTATYDLSARTAKCAVLETILNWANLTNWRLGPRTEEPKTCTQ